MKKIKIKVYTMFDKKEENSNFLAIKNDDVIKYIDLENNKMTIDMKNNIIIRENEDYLFNIKLDNNEINIRIKKLKKEFNKKIKTLIINKTNKSYLIRYLLTDDNIYNEYYVTY